MQPALKKINAVLGSTLIKTIKSISVVNFAPAILRKKKKGLGGSSEKGERKKRVRYLIEKSK